jgi:hypothetical protein
MSISLRNSDEARLPKNVKEIARYDFSIVRQLKRRL